MIDLKWEEKFKFFKEQLSNNSEDLNLWLKYARFLEDECDSPLELVKVIKKIQVLQPAKDLRLQLGDAYISAGEFDIGFELIKEYLSENKNVEGFCILAEAYRKSNQKEEAISACKEALKINQNYEEAYYLLGEIVKDSSKYEAIDYYKKAIELDQNYQLAYAALGRELIGISDHLQEGLEYLKIAYNLNNEDGWTALYLANAYWKAKNYKQAEEMYKETITLFPEFDKPRKWFANFLDSQGRFNEANEQRKIAKDFL